MLVEPVLDGTEGLTLGDVDEAGELRLRLGTPGMVGSVRKLVDRIDDRIAGKRQIEFLTHRMMNDREARPQYDLLGFKDVGDVPTAVWDHGRIITVDPKMHLVMTGD